MAQEKREASGDTKGLAAETGTPSDAPGTTSPQPNGEIQPVAFDLRATYVDPSDPSKVISGTDLKARLNRGLQADKVRSDADRANDRAEKAEAAFADTLAKLETAQMKLTDIDTEARIQRLIQETGLKDAGDNRTAGTIPTGDDWLSADPENGEPPATRADLLRGLQAMQEHLEKQTGSQVQEEFTKQRAKEESQERVNQFVARTLAVTREELKARAPDAPEEDITNVMQLLAQSGEFSHKARELVQAGNEADGEEPWARSQGAMLEALERMNEITLKQKTANEERERAEMIQTVTKGGPPGETKTPRKGIFNKKKAAVAATEALEAAREKERQIARIKNT